MSNVLTWLNDNLGFGAIDKIASSAFGISAVPSFLKHSSNRVDTARELANGEMLYNADEAQKNRDFQERMSNTAYQRAVEDMKKAGLNPYLAYSQGGASVPSGSVANYSGYSSSYLSSKQLAQNNKLNALTALAVAAIRIMK